MKCEGEKCRKTALKGRTLCRACRYKREKELDPVRVAYTQLKANVARRNKHRAEIGVYLIPFEISLEEFRKECYEVELLLGRGRKSTSYHVDRKIEALGYTPGNLQKLTNAENVRKENKRRRLSRQYDYERRAGWWLELNQRPLKYQVDPEYGF